MWAKFLWQHADVPAKHKRGPAGPKYLAGLAGKNARNVVGPSIRKIRMSQTPYMSQVTLAAKLEAFGWEISQGKLALIEAQKRGLWDYEIILIAKALKVPVSALFEPLA